MYIFLSSVVFFGLVSTIIYLSLFTRKKYELPLPPGELGWPVVGETLAFYKSGVKNCHRSFFSDRMKKHSSVVFKTSILGEKMAVICGPIGNKFVFFNENNLLRQWMPPTVFKVLSAGIQSSKLSYSIRMKLRHALSDLINMDALHDYVPIIHSMTDQHLKTEWCPNETVKVLHLANQLTFTLACKLFIGLEDPDTVKKIERHYANLTAGLMSLPVDLPGTALNKSIKAAKAIHDEMIPIIKHERKNSKLGEKSDILSRLLTFINEDGQLISDEHIALQIIGILLASHGTISSVITSAVYYLADHPQIYNRVSQEQMEIFTSKGSKETLKWEDTRKMKYLKNVVNEVLRIAPPAVGFFKEALSDFTFAGYTIPKGWKVFWSVHTTHESPEYFSNPEKFDPSRFEGKGPLPFTFTNFGGGPSMCPGSEFARIETLIILHCLVTRFRWKKLIPDEQLTSIMSPEPAHGLPVRLFPHKH